MQSLQSSFLRTRLQFFCFFLEDWKTEEFCWFSEVFHWPYLYVWSTNISSQKIPTQTIGIISSNSATLVQVYLLKALKCLLLPLISVKFQIYWSLYTKRSLYTVVYLFMDGEVGLLKKKKRYWENMHFARSTIKSTYSGVVLKIAFFYRTNTGVKSHCSPGYKIALLCAESAGQRLEFVHIFSLVGLWIRRGSDSLLEYSAAT